MKVLLCYGKVEKEISEFFPHILYADYITTEEDIFYIKHREFRIDIKTIYLWAEKA